MFVTTCPHSVCPLMFLFGGTCYDVLPSGGLCTSRLYLNVLFALDHAS